MTKKQSLAYSLIVSMFFAVSSFESAQAASSDWQDLGGGKARLIASVDPKTGVVSGAVEVQLEPGWSTYWRYPGSSGIPPRFDFSASKGFTIKEVEFPTPKLVTYTIDSGGSYAGYKNNVTFPFKGEMISSGSGSLNLNLLIGVCEEICIPARAEMSIAANKLLISDPSTVRTVSFAQLSVPKEKPAAEKIANVDMPDHDTMHIKVKHEKRFGKPALFVEGPSDWYLKPAKLVSQAENTATFALDVSQAPEGTDILGTQLRYTLVAGTQGFDIWR